VLIYPRGLRGFEDVSRSCIFRVHRHPPQL